MRTSRSLTAILAGLTALALFGGAVLAQEDDGAGEDMPPPSAAAPEELVDRLVDLLVQVDDDALAEFTDETDPELGQVVGDYVGLDVRLEALSADFRSLFQDADESVGPTSAAVADVARAMLQVESAVGYFAQIEDFDLDRSLATSDADGVATGADPPFGLLNVGLDLFEDAVLRAHDAYQVLIDAPEIDDQERAFFESEFNDAVTVLDVTIPLQRELVGGRTTAVLVPTERFDAGPDDARARTTQYVCIDRSVYPLSGNAADADTDATPYGNPVEAADCPDLPASEEGDADLDNVVTVAP